MKNKAKIYSRKKILRSIILNVLAINIILGLITYYILKSLEIGSPDLFGPIAFIIYCIIGLLYIAKNKDKLYEIYSNRTVHIMMLVLFNIGAGALISSIILISKGIVFSMETFDFLFLALFCMTVSWFINKNKQRVKTEGILILYRTQVGIRLISYIGENFRKTLGLMKYFIIITGYVLMIGIVFLITNTVILYITRFQQVTNVIKAPPIAPVIPYFPKLFGMESFFPSFPFTSFLISLAIVAIVHEFSHGIYMKYSKVRIKSTGIAFLGPILGAFVEQNEKDMEKASKSNQLSILGAGVFANIITAGIAFVIWWVLFYFAFFAQGVTFDMYTAENVKISSIVNIGGVNVENLSNKEIIQLIETKNLTKDIELKNNDENLVLTKIRGIEKSYYMTPEILIEQLKSNRETIALYSDLPAINAGLRGTIIQIDDKRIFEFNDLNNAMAGYKPGDRIMIKTIHKGEELLFDITTAKDPDPENPDRAIIGIVNRNLRINIVDRFAIFKQPFTMYETRNELFKFIYFIVFWIFLINLLVGFFNMLPVSILDGGRFFFLTIWAAAEKIGVKESEKYAKLASKSIGYIILLGFILMMISWVIGIST